MSRFEYYYNEVLRYELISSYNYNNSYEIPKINGIHFHITSKSAIDNNKNIFPPMLALEMISGQKAHIIKAKHSISSFKLRKGGLIACHVTLRNAKFTYPALEYLASSVLVKEDREILKRGWCHDDEGNVSLGIRDCFSYKELEEEYDKFSKWIKGLQITVTMSSNISKKGLLRTHLSCNEGLCAGKTPSKRINQIRDLEAKKRLLQGFQLPIK